MSNNQDRLLALAGIFQAAFLVDQIAKKGSGLESIIQQMTASHSDKIDVTRYVLQLMHLSGKLSKRADRLHALSEGIKLAKSRSESFAITHTNILAQLAELYSKNISDLSSRIMVNGEPLHLNNPDNVHKIRAL